MDYTIQNEQLKQLKETDKSTAYGEFAKSKAFMESFHSFFYLVLDWAESTDDFHFFPHLRYQRNPEESLVYIGSSRTAGALLFNEKNAGREITIHELITMKD